MTIHGAVQDPHHEDTACLDISTITFADNVFLTVLDDKPWTPRWFMITGRNRATEHSKDIKYYKVLLQHQHRREIMWMADRTLATFCWDESQQSEWLAKEELACQVSQQDQTY